MIYAHSNFSKNRQILSLVVDKYPCGVISKGRQVCRGTCIDAPFWFEPLRMKLFCTLSFSILSNEV